MKTKNNLFTYLKRYFQYDKFKTGQKEIIEDVLKNKDVLGILPTGSGKSLCYQLPALMREGTTIVITPLISLMIDQVRELKIRGIRDVVALNSFISWRDRQDIYTNLSKYKIVYISPELIQHDLLLNSLKKLHINLFVIDEAHCISQWGHEFRMDYLRLKDVITRLGNPPILALTATATKEVQDDILNILHRPQAVRHIFSVDRPNIIFSVESLNNEDEKLDRLINVLSRFRVPTLVYFSSRIKCELVVEEIRKRLPYLRASFYHGGMDSLDRLTIQQQFMNDQIDVICCTSAFGMGINKQNLRQVIHYHFPIDLESYSQEVGRAGRDGLPSLGLVLYNQADLSLQKHIIHQRFPERDSIMQLEYFLLQNKRKEYHSLKSNLLTIVRNNEIHLQFLHYHLEKHGIINNNRIIEDEQSIINFINDILLHINIRHKTKTNKLMDMLQWLQSKSCLRSYIYNYFDSNYENLVVCCSNCGFSIEDWQPIEAKSIAESAELNWRRKLSKLLLTGV